MGKYHCSEIGILSRCIVNNWGRGRDRGRRCRSVSREKISKIWLPAAKPLVSRQTRHTVVKGPIEAHTLHSNMGKPHYYVIGTRRFQRLLICPSAGREAFRHSRFLRWMVPLPKISSTWQFPWQPQLVLQAVQS